VARRQPLEKTERSVAKGRSLLHLLEPVNDTISASAVPLHQTDGPTLAKIPPAGFD
jgi:hypothetical protein